MNSKSCKKKNGTRFQKECPAGHRREDRCCISCKCPPGQERQIPCQGECTRCPPGRFSSDGLRCKPCKGCEALGVTTIRNCTATKNSECTKTCTNKNAYYDDTLFACRLFERQKVDPTTKIVPHCMPHQLNSVGNGCTTVNPSNAGMFPLIGVGGVVLLVCAILILFIAIVALVFCYFQSRRQKKNAMAGQDLVLEDGNERRPFRSMDNEYAEISEPGSPPSSDAATMHGQRNPEEENRLRRQERHMC